MNCVEAVEVGKTRIIGGLLSVHTFPVVNEF